MHRSHFAVSAVFLALCATSSVAQTYRAGDMTVTAPWIRSTPPGAPTAAGYLTVTNHGTKPDSLLGGKSPDFRSVELHQMSMDGQIMRMRPIVGGLVIAPGQSVTLAPGGDRHLMLVAPSHVIKVGDRIPVILQFSKAAPVETTFVVRAEGAPVTGPKPMSMPGMDMR
jgi:copper(I)-binding protein